MSVKALRVVRVAETRLTHNTHGSGLAVEEWMELDPAASAADTLAEFGGRGCYESWHKPNPATAANADYCAHVLDVGHFSLFSHAAVSYRIEGVSRALTHELIRHRFPTFSQLSQRFVRLDNDLPYVEPPICRGDQFAEEILAEAASDALKHYEELVAHLARQHPEVKPKKIREAARAVLPNMTETKLLMSANLRAWRDLLEQRLPPEADAEIRELAQALLEDLRRVAPSSFADIPDFEAVEREFAATLPVESP